MSVVRKGALPTDHQNSKSTANVLDDGRMVIEHENDVSGILRANHFQQTTTAAHHESETVNHVARIDVLAIKNWMAARGVTKDWWAEFMKDDKLLKAFLNDPDNKCWRTRLGKI